RHSRTHTTPNTISPPPPRVDPHRKHNQGRCHCVSLVPAHMADSETTQQSDLHNHNTYPQHPLHPPNTPALGRVLDTQTLRTETMRPCLVRTEVSAQSPGGEVVESTPPQETEASSSHIAIE
ncbi:hypothetical protein HMPREF9004_0738, partial [Schaalia cardiffensis F0333]